MHTRMKIRAAQKITSIHSCSNSMYFLLLRRESIGMRDISVNQDEYTALVECALLFWDMRPTLSQPAVFWCPRTVTQALGQSHRPITSCLPDMDKVLGVPRTLNKL